MVGRGLPKSPNPSAAGPRCKTTFNLALPQNLGYARCAGFASGDVARARCIPALLLHNP